ncbi:lovastatin nonaketide synthase [Lophiotrema nucula]|uniref:Lovastatin nonaketide synthase n=1 Tax=Lophiotrema nucula TaxID=690887 RepID=A0A6A5ZPR3_9PLEO|nr:lovastatin nonaketide synthase [Lophiotrema nucula]
MTLQQAEPIAIVGSGCRFPGGADSPSALWQLLKQPRDVVQEIPPERFDTTGFFHADANHHSTSNVRHAYLLEQDLRLFDTQFFFISPNEADSMDPQQRLLLETVYEALEAGGHSLEALRGSDTAVYVGTMGVDWNDIAIRDLDSMPTYFATGTNRAIISNRVSYFFDWHGPSMTIDTACSSSLVAVHQGVQALRSGESRVAVACGTQVILGPETFIIESKMKMLSPTGRSRMWDADADGYARGEGVAAIVMKRLSDALADGDEVQCLIRETGTNQDGNSNGLTVPSSAAQAALIRKTYAKAGLDLSASRDRPQYFEAHGTGTQAGDPKEAAAIFETFGKNRDAGSAPLYVGSAKTVIGHTEGAAGLAGLLKAAASIQKGLIAPNLLFNRLNPAIEPFYQSLQVPTDLTPWPELPTDVPRRASVNSFGFGGSNAHAILEQYVEAPVAPDNFTPKASSTPFTPFVFSAASEPSLVAQLEAYSSHLKTRSEIDLQDLAFTLQARRSQLAVKAAFAASSVEELTSKIDQKLATTKQNSTLGTRSNASNTKASILGVFTGQGAQWAAMGAHLIRASPGFVGKRIQDLEETLATLPAADRPQWSLRDEMLAGSDTSRLAEAALSQPLCTALQIVLVDLLRSAGITFSAVVGHSSGEIAAAYTAGYLSDRDAMRVAYYRGLYAHLAGGVANNTYGPAKSVGAMLAVGTSLEDAQDLINLSAFKGCLAVAAHNSLASVTLSGNVSAVLLAKKVFDEEKKFSRLLKVDTAYHSHHMAPCGDPYISALRTCGVRVCTNRTGDCAWYSSVIPDVHQMQPGKELQDVYWRDNMSNTVLFADAVRNAMVSNPQISLAIEVGPHPALKGPATQNIADVRATGLPYYGVLNRGQNDVEAFAEALGFIWTQLGAQSVNFETYRKVATALPEDTAQAGPRRPKLVTGLPSYQWNHTRRHWHESRRSVRLRSRKQPFHELLGVLLPESTARDLRWKNVLKPAEIPWLEGHQLQGQTVFPAAGYVAMALEAARLVATGSKMTIELFELHDLSIPKAIAFDDGDNSGVETLVTLTGVRPDGPNIMAADFSCYSCPISNTASEPHEMELMASGITRLIIGTPDAAALSSPPVPDTSNMGDVDDVRFYSSLTELGYNYSGPFRTMSSMKRRLNQSSALVSTYSYDQDSDATYLVHPSLLDVAFQVAFLAYSAPGDGRLWSLHIPTAIGRIRVNPEQSAALPLSGTDVPVWSTVTSGNKAGEPFSASIDILNYGSDATTSSSSSMVQVEDLILKPFAPATASDDRSLFTSTQWHVARPDGSAAVQGLCPTDGQVELARLCERVSFHYLCKWKAELSEDEWANSQPHFLSLHNFVNHTLDTVASGQHGIVKREWSNDTPKDIAGFMARYPNSVDLQLISAVGEHMVAAVRGETTIIEHMVAGNMLDDYYARGGDSAPMNTASAAMVKQITRRYPHARILEIGAGTGGATKAVFGAIGNTMSSYTYTDISTGFFDKAAEVFEAYSDRMAFKVLDAERSPATQGFELHSYDIVIANNVLHATSVLQHTLENTRQLLKPGGWLILAELTDKAPVRFGTIMGGLQGWWLGVEDGRKYMPILTPVEWHAVLRKAGFGGVDALTPVLDAHATWPWSIIAAQAVDDRINLLRRPLLTTPSSTSSPMYLDSIVILGTQSLESARIAEELAEHLSRFSHRVTILDGLPTEEEAQSLAPMSSFINLVDLDQPIFKNITSKRMEALKRVFELARNLLWVTHGAISAENPYHMASVAFRRVMSSEAQHICLHHLDLADLAPDKNVSKTIAEHLLRQAALDEWEREAPTTDKLRRHAFLWSKEPEAFVDRRGRLLIPRLIHDPAQNARLNSSRRIIARTVPSDGVENASISLRSDVPASLVEQKLSTSNTTISKVRTEASSLMALSVAGEAFLFLGIGKEIVEESNHVIFLSTVNSSVIAPVTSLPVPAVKGDHLQFLGAVASELVAASVIQPLPSGSNIVIHSVSSAKDQVLAEALRRQAEAKAVRTAFVTTASNAILDPQSEARWISLDKRAPKHALKRLLPFEATHFLDLTATHSPNYESSSLSRLIPALAKSIGLNELARLDAQFHPSRKQALLARLQDAVTSAVAAPRLAAISDVVVPLDQIHQKQQAYLSDVVRWSPMTSDHVKVEVRPLDARHLFAANKSYLLLGLTGEIGRSVCGWMVANGAGCVCLASRTPKANDTWLQSFKDTGALIKQYAVDVADKSSLARLIDVIRTDCPPLSGIINGAMVLRDSLFSKMSVDMMQAVLTPKIEGSNNLDELFHNDPLDFFLLLSSSTTLIGNPGQSSYVIANGYLNGLVRQRRRRGLAASAVDIGRVAGLGYVETAGEHVMNQLTNFRLLPISETELHQVFAEAIHAGYPDSHSADEGDGVAFPEAIVTTGLGTIRDDEDVRGPYFENPLFSHCIIETAGLAASEVENSDSNKKNGNNLPILDQLASATTNEQALDLLRDSFAAKLCSILQITSGTPDQNAPLVELGMDSLVAVEARSWFLKNLKVDIPVLKIVGGSTLSEVCEIAFKKLPEDLLAKIGSSEPKPTEPVVLPAQSQTLSSSPKSPSSTTSASDDSTPNLRGSTVDTPISSVAETPLESLHKGVLDSAKLSEASFKTFIKSEPISIAQSRFWFLRLLVEDPTTFNVTLRYRMTGHVRVGDLERALRAVTARHESLRTCFIADENEVDQASQKILARSPVKLEHKKVQSAEDAVAEYDRLRAHEFDLASGSLLRIILLTLSPTSHYLLVNAHHIIMDVTSFQILLSDMEKAYNGDHLGARPRQYPEFSVAQRQALDEGQLNNELNYWRSIFPTTDPPPILPLLPMARSSSRTAIANYEVYQVDTRIESALATRIRSVAKAHRSTPFHFYLAAFKVMLFCFIDPDIQDLTIGIADANRNDSDLIGSVGFFMNLLTLRFRRQARQSFADAIVEARNTAYAALEHSRLPFDVLLKELKVARSSSYNPFFQAFFDYRQIDRGRQTWLQCQFDVEDYHPGRSGYDISLDVADLGPEVQIALRVQKSFYDVTAANLLLDTYTHVIDVLSRDSSLSLQSTPLYSEEQLSRALSVGCGPDLATDWPETLPHRIDLIARENADKIALQDGLGSSLTYQAMIKRVEAIAEALSKAGAGQASRVLVFQQASTDWVCSMLAIMRIGGVYVPLDLRNPISRLATLSSDCQPTVLLADDNTIGDAPQLGVAIAINVAEVASAPSGPVANIARSDLPAAILYTSGSTGTPKGIVIRHSGIRNEMEGYTKMYKLGAERVLQQSAFTFDFSVDQIFTGLVHGGMVYIVPYAKRGDPISITEIIRQESITYTKVTPSEYSMWMEFGLDNLRKASSWRFAFAGGEPLTNHVLQQFAQLSLGQLQLYNSYGPAEISIASHKGLVDYNEERQEEEEPVPCGSSLPNYSTYILDDNLKPVPVGMPGEVVIGGASVSFGYLTDQERTASAFVQNPYANSRQIAEGWTRMHRTGDVGHLRGDGSLIFRHRIAGDTQVKLRGLRIDLRDIETNLVSAAGGVLKAAIVTLRKGDPDYLVAHVVFKPQHNIDNVDAFLEHLLGRLPIPQYMVPVLAIPLDEFPLTNHAKVDRKAILNLALPRRVATDNQSDMQMTETMVQLRQLWREVLGKDSESLGLTISTSTNFFMIGGNSLLIVRLQSRIRQTFNVTVRLVDLLSANTLEQMARKVEESAHVGVIDWEEEAKPPLIPNFVPQSRNGKQKGSLTVLVTGATGNLAKRLLPPLAAHPSVGKLVCVAVRDRPSEPSRKLLRADKIVQYSGDLAAPRLGLTEEEFQALSNEVDVILHLGAVRSFWDNYHMLRLSNVQSTRELVQLAAPYQIPIHFVSTSGVLPRDVLESTAVAGAAPSAAVYEPPADGSDGYCASKWASERLLERSTAGLGVPSFIYRLHPPTGSPQLHNSKTDALDEFVRCVDLAGVMPDCTGWEGHVDLIPGEQVAKGLCDSVISSARSNVSAGTGSTGTQFTRFDSTVTVSVDDIKTYLEEKRGHAGLERLQILKWMGRIKAVGFSYILASLETTLGDGKGENKLVSRR